MKLISLSGNFYLRSNVVLILLLLLGFLACKEENKSADETSEVSESAPKSATQVPAVTDLIIPGGFESLVVADSLGPSRHLAVNSNGDIYVKLKEPKEKIGLGNVALRDLDGDGRADSIVRFGTYENDGAFATEMRIHNGYLYFSSELTVYRQKLELGKLIPESPEERIILDPYPIR